MSFVIHRILPLVILFTSAIPTSNAGARHA